MSIEIVEAVYLDDYRIELRFSDGMIQIVDFKDFKIEFGDLVWNDYELCFPIIDLYENVFLKKMHSVA